MNFIDALKNLEQKLAENREQHSEFVQECQRFKFIAKECPEKAKKFDEQKDSAAYLEYSFGGEVLHRGYYCPSPTIDLVIGGCNRGKLIKPSNSKRSFEYYFNVKKRLIAVKHLTVDEEVIIDQGVRSIGYIFYLDGTLSGISECNYTGDKISSYINCQYNAYNEEITSYQKEEYNYIDGLLQSTDMYVFTPSIMLLQHSKYEFQHDGNGCLSCYQVIEYDGDIEKPDSRIYQIKIKRKV